MPRHEIFIQAGQLVGGDLRGVLLRYFNDPDIQRLERLGGRVALTITAPYRKVSKKQKVSVAVDIDFLKRLSSLRDRPEELKEALGNLDVRSLKRVCELAGLPTRSGASATEIRADLMSYIRAEEIWRRISGGEPIER